MENYQLAFIPAENYITKIQLPFGTGVVACYSEEDAMRLNVIKLCIILVVVLIFLILFKEQLIELISEIVHGI